MNRKMILGLLIAVAAISIPLHAATLYVDTADPSCDDQGPGSMQVPFCSIQAGYDTAADGDELRVMPATYNECAYLYNATTQKGVSVVADDYLSSGDNTSTIIDGTGLNCIFPGEDGGPASVVNVGGIGGRLEGFTVTGATTSGIFGIGPVIITNNVVRDNDSAFDGGGVYVYSGTCYYGDTVTEVSWNEITDNNSVGGGGGLSIAAGQQLESANCQASGDATVNVENNTITGNTSDGSGGGILAAAYTAEGALSAEIVITSNTISGNGASSEEFFGWGGGIFAYTYGFGTESIQVTSNTIATNTTQDSGGGASIWIDPQTNDTSIDHEIVFGDNSLVNNQAGFGGGGLDVLLRTADFRTNQRADVHVYDNTVTGNTLTVDSPLQTLGGGGILAFHESNNSNSSRIAVLVEENDVSNNAAFVFGGGVSVISQATADPNSAGTGVNAAVELRSNLITRNNASTDAVGWDGGGGGVFILLETKGDALSRVDAPLNTIADNTIDTLNEAGGIHVESFIDLDASQNEGAAVLTMNSSIVASNDGIGFGGPATGEMGYITPEGGDNFTVTITYSDLHGNESGDLEGWVPPGGDDNISEDPLLAPFTYFPERCSPTIDAGDPTFDFASEPPANGGRVNMGSTGNTSDATTSVADASGDGLVDGIDIVRLSVAFGAVVPDARYNAAVDINSDNMVDGDDLTLMAPDFGRTCP